MIQSLIVKLGQRIGQCRMNASVGAGNGFGAEAFNFNDIDGGQDDRLPPQAFDERFCEHQAFVCLQGQFGNRAHRLPIVARGEGLEPEHGLQLDQMLTPCLIALAILVPAFQRHLELLSHQTQQRRKRRCIDAQDNAGESQVAEMNSEAQTVRAPSALINDGKIRFAKSVESDQLVLGLWQREQAVALGGSQDRTARHSQSSCRY
jgi:hypothetical protein